MRSTDFAGRARIAEMQSCMMMLSSGSSTAGANAVAGRALTFSMTLITATPVQERRIPADAGLSVKQSLVNDLGCQIVNKPEHFGKPSRY